MSEESRLFLRRFLRRPKQIGSIVPSSGYLSRRMVSAIPWHRVGTIAELGAGTGAITGEIARMAVSTAKVFVFEKDAKMRQRLKRMYPEFICGANVTNLSLLLEAYGLSGGLDCIVSGLPFYNFSEPVREMLLGHIFEALKPGGLFVAFQYSLQMRKPLSRKFEIERIDFVPLNFPPAFVYVCRKR
ncbi:methyltransferase domain-containing protein [Cohnella endophytica]|uniref:Methyltransferase domain-containing protein n=2 Tax=Cohnella endophytica TaxID=2419778 RepID=A0A494Y8B3_9BACL|nr:methyltransferase domain-containing protein [Cohnella endophytica]